MPDIYIAKRVIDYVGLGARGIPEHTLPVLDKVQPTLALLQAMGPDGAKLVTTDTQGNLLTTEQFDPYQVDTQFAAERANFGTFMSDVPQGPALGGMQGQFTSSLVQVVGGVSVWVPTFGSENAPTDAEFQSTNRVNGNPWFIVRAQLPTQANILGGGFVRFGVKASGGGNSNGRFWFDITATQLLARYFSDDLQTTATIDITASLPVNYNTALHNYAVIVREDGAYWEIDSVVVAKVGAAQVRTTMAGSYLFHWYHSHQSTVQIRIINWGSSMPGRRISTMFPSVSAVNAAQQVVLDLLDAQNMLDILSVASGGTATLQIEVSTDNVNWTSIDTLAAALTQAKHYLNTTVGVTVALCPLAFRFIRVTAGAAGIGFTTTLTVSAK